MSVSLVLKFLRKEKPLFYIFLLATVFSFSINLIGKQFTEPIYLPWASELGDLVSNICIGFIVSYLFYFIVVFAKSEQDKKNISEVIAWQSNIIVIQGRSLHKSIVKNNTHVKSFPPSLDELETACKDIDPFNSPLVHSSKTLHWNAFVKSKVNEIQWSLNKLYPIYPLIDSELIGILTSIEKSQLFIGAEFAIIPTVKTEHNSSYKGMEHEFYPFFVLISKLEQYLEVHYDNDFPKYKSKRTERY